MNSREFRAIKSLLQFDLGLLRDEVGLETWSTSNSNVKTNTTYAKFGSASLYTYMGYLISTNDTGIWSLNSSSNYEVEFFVYPTAHGGTRYLFQLTTPKNSSYNHYLRLSLNSTGTIGFASDEWGYSTSSNPIDGTTVLSVNEWHHIMLRISNQKAVVFLDGTQEISADLPEDVTLSNTQARLGYFSTPSCKFYMDEFVFRHSAGTGEPIIPKRAYFYSLEPQRKRKFGTIKSLLHFDYPYFNEPDDGLGDEVSSETWIREGNTKLAGTEIPYEIEGSPKFGYRCAYFPDTNSYITGTNTSEIFNLSPSGEYEIEAFVKLSGTGGNIFKIGDLELVADNTGVMSLSSQSWDISCDSGENTLTKEEWEHILLRLSGGNAEVYLDGSKVIETTITGNTNITPSSVVLGGFVGYMDEFVFRHSAGSVEPSIPSRPYSGTLNVNSVGSFGDGSDGDVVISTDDTQINSYGMISAVSSGSIFSVSAWFNSSSEDYGRPFVGSEIMLHITAPKSTATASYPYVGFYAFGRVAGIDGGDITLEKEISEENGQDFTLSSELLSDYYVQAITVPHFNNITVNADGVIYPLLWGTSDGGGIVAFRCRSDCTVNGSILVHGDGAARYDLQQMTHSKLIDRFLCSEGGGIFITCGGTFTASNNARLGAWWDGSLGAGQGVKGSSNNGGAGYGGSGKGDRNGTGGNGGIGGGGGGCGNSPGGHGYDAGVGGTGGYGNPRWNGDNHKVGTPGTQGNTPGGKGIKSSNPISSITPGGGAGGASPFGDSTYSPVAYAGANVILVAGTLCADPSAISTGGQGGVGYYGGGGRTGFCYISCGEQVSVNA